MGAFGVHLTFFLGMHNPLLPISLREPRIAAEWVDVAGHRKKLPLFFLLQHLASQGDCACRHVQSAISGNPQYISIFFLIFGSAARGDGCACAPSHTSPPLKTPQVYPGNALPKGVHVPLYPFLSLLASRLHARRESPQRRKGLERHCLAPAGVRQSKWRLLSDTGSPYSALALLLWAPPGSGAGARSPRLSNLLGHVTAAVVMEPPDTR